MMPVTRYARSQTLSPSTIIELPNFQLIIVLHERSHQKDLSNERSSNSDWNAGANPFGICRAIWSWQGHAGQSTYDQISGDIWIQRLKHNAPTEVRS